MHRTKFYEFRTSRDKVDLATALSNILMILEDKNVYKWVLKVLKKVPRETSILCALEIVFCAFEWRFCFGSALLCLTTVYAVLMMIIWLCLSIINGRTHMWKLREVSN